MLLKAMTEMFFVSYFERFVCVPLSLLFAGLQLGTQTKLNITLLHNISEKHKELIIYMNYKQIEIIVRKVKFKFLDKLVESKI